MSLETVGGTDGWIRVADELPKEGVDVETAIIDEKGIRMVQRLRRTGRLWFIPDGGGMYVYYDPTHWRAKR